MPQWQKQLLAALTLGASLALPVVHLVGGADSLSADVAQELVQPEQRALGQLATHLRRAEAAPAPGYEIDMLSSITQGFITQVAAQSMAKPPYAVKPQSAVSGSKKVDSGGDGTGMHSPVNAITKMLLGSLTAGQGPNGSAVASQILDTAMSGLTDATGGAVAHAALVAQIVLAIFSTPASQRVLSNPLSLANAQVVKGLIADSLPLESVQTAISKYLTISAPEIVAAIGYPDGMSPRQFAMFEKAVVHEISAALAGSVTADALRGKGSYDTVADTITRAIGVDMVAGGVAPAAVESWRPAARSTLAHFGYDAQRHVVHAASKVAAKATVAVAGVADNAAAVLTMLTSGQGPSPAQVSQVLAGLMAVGGGAGR